MNRACVCVCVCVGEDGRQGSTLHFQASGLLSCSCFILFPRHAHQSSPTTTHTTDST